MVNEPSVFELLRIDCTVVTENIYYFFPIVKMAEIMQKHDREWILEEGFQQDPLVQNWNLQNIVIKYYKLKYQWIIKSKNKTCQ